jgi:hypothetical protein
MPSEKPEFDFEYQGKKYRWIRTYQGAIECACPSCREFVNGLSEEGFLEEIK